VGGSGVAVAAEVGVGESAVVGVGVLVGVVVGVGVLALPQVMFTVPEPVQV
jgi:hypothetical protein